jgi:2,4-dichlorophenol 6-monooxygenase
LPGARARSAYGDWARLSEISDAGALLVRPDGFVAFRHPTAAPDAGTLLTDALRQVLGHA